MELAQKHCFIPCRNPSGYKPADGASEHAAAGGARLQRLFLGVFHCSAQSAVPPEPAHGGSVHPPKL